MKVLSAAQGQMLEFMRNFKGNDVRLQKYIELLLLGGDASSESFMAPEHMRCVTVVLTTKCNLKCVWCHRHETRFRRDYLNREMPVEILSSLLPNLKGFKRIYYGGLGEPLLYKDIYRAIEEARKSCDDVRTTTNGTLLKKESSQQLRDSGLSYLEVSIDGFDRKTNELVRGVHEDYVIEHLKYLSDISTIPLQINSVISKTNIESLYDAVDRLADIRNLVMLHTIPLFMTEHMKNLGVEDVSADEHRMLLQHWKGRIRDRGLKIEVWPDVNETVLDPIRAMKQRRNLCFTVYDDALVNVHGCLSPCSRLQDISFDNIAEAGFDAAWNGTRMQQWRQQQLRGCFSSVCQLECHMRNEETQDNGKKDAER